MPRRADTLTLEPEDVEYDPSAEALGHHRPDVEAYADLAADLRDRLSGDVQFDEYAQVLYASDGSIYQARPAGVVFPTDVEDVRATMKIASEHDVPVLPRGAGTSLSGGAVGPGCVVLDFSRHMDEILDVERAGKEVTVQPGVVLDHLNRHLDQYDLKFAPDPASSNRSTIGGAIGNNSTGAHSVRYGITDAFTEELRVVLSDGSVIHTRDVVLDSPEYEAILSKNDREAEIYETVRGLIEENEDEIEARYPDLKRSVSGYNLQKVIDENEDGDRVMNLSKLFVGAEGTLGVVIEATLSLVTQPDSTALVLYCFEELVDAMKAVPQALEYDVSVVELLDDEVFRLASESSEYAQYVEEIPDRTTAALMIEFDSELVEDFASAVSRTNRAFVEDGEAFRAIEAFTDAEQDDFWHLRKAAIPLLMSLQGDPKPYPFIEDATVPPADLAAYVQEFDSVLEAHDTSAAYFAHAGSGTLHIRPILDLKTEHGVETMHSITEDVTDIVLEHHGAFSGEHGDGMARTEFNPKMYGEKLWDAFKRVKTAFDPNWLLHPGNVVYRADPSDPGPDNERGVGADNRDNLRYGADYHSIEPTTQLDFDDEGGFSHLVELCNGCGNCRQSDAEVMCPTYRASKEEIQSTRGRANLLRAAISGELDEEELHSDRFQEEVLGLCIGCKGCKNDCPTGVDMAKLKAEVKHQHHDQLGSSLRERLFADIDELARLGSRFAPVSNWLSAVPGARRVMEKILGIAADRELPTFRRTTLMDWFDDRGGCKLDPTSADDRVMLFPDTYTNYIYPEAGKAAVRVLESAGVYVSIPEDVTASGRAAFSAGLLDLARDRARENVDALYERGRDGWKFVFVEPSDAVVFQDEYLDLLDDGRVETVSENAYGILEYLDAFRRDEHFSTTSSAETIAYHGHCNQKAINKDHHAVGVLRRAGYEVDPLDTTCCGMAGSFGYEAEHVEVSKAIARLLVDEIEASPAQTVTAPGASCRSQLSDRPDATRPPHPIEKVADVLA